MESFARGDRATFTPRGSTDPHVVRTAGPVTVVRPLTAAEADLDETGPMYRVQGDSGVCDAFVDELAREA